MRPIRDELGARYLPSHWSLNPNDQGRCMAVVFDLLVERLTDSVFIQQFDTVQVAAFFLQACPRVRDSDSDRVQRRCLLL